MTMSEKFSSIKGDTTVVFLNYVTIYLFTPYHT